MNPRYKRWYLERRRDVLRAVRQFFDHEGFLEVETPIRVPSVAPEQHIEPFSSEGYFLITSPELQMKMLLAEGYDKIFQLTKVFRKGERGRLHLPEFTLLEWYRRDCSYEHLMEDCQALFAFIARSLHLPCPFSYADRYLDYQGTWQVFTVKELFIQCAGWDPFNIPEEREFSLELVDLYAWGRWSRPSASARSRASCETSLVPRESSHAVMVRSVNGSRFTGEA